MSGAHCSACVAALSMFRVYLTCVNILEARGERERAQSVLEEAHALLVQRVTRLAMINARSYLENVRPTRGDAAMGGALKVGGMAPFSPFSVRRCDHVNLVASPPIHDLSSLVPVQ